MPLTPSSLDEKRKTVLLVDDEPAILNMARQLLESRGFRACLASSCQQAIEIYQNKPIDAVILDLEMPIIDGRQCLGRLLEIDPGARVIISSGYPDAQAQDQQLKAAAGFLAKPYDSKELLAALKKVLECC